MQITGLSKYAAAYLQYNITKNARCVNKARHLMQRTQNPEYFYNLLIVKDVKKYSCGNINYQRTYLLL